MTVARRGPKPDPALSAELEAWWAENRDEFLADMSAELGVKIKVVEMTPAEWAAMVNDPRVLK